MASLSIQAQGTSIIHELSQSPTEERCLELLNMGETLIQTHGQNQSHSETLSLLDRKLVPLRKDGGYRHSSNVKDLKRWTRYEFPQEIFDSSEKTVRLLLDTPIGSQMKITDDTPEIRDEKPCILLNGTWTPCEEIAERFSCEWAPGFNEHFMVDNLHREVYTYLGNGQGLQKHHPFIINKPRPIAHLKEEEFERTLAAARKFVRPSELELCDGERQKLNEERTYICQIVSSYVEGWNSNATELLQRRKHPWIRVICANANEELETHRGDVIEVGFGWSKKVSLFASTSTGRFRNQDAWNYLSPKERVVTNIAITAEEAQKIYRYTMDYHRDNINLGRPIGFNLRNHNCSAFVHYALLAAGIDVPTEIPVPTVVARIAPDWLRSLGASLYRGGSNVRAGIKSCFTWVPRPIHQFAIEAEHRTERLAFRALDALAATIANVGLFFSGGAIGQEGRAFHAPDEVEGTVGAPLKNAKTWYSLSQRVYHLPGILQEWQRQQASTVIYENPTKLSIVPPEVNHE